MAEVGVTHDTAARLIGVAPGELETLVRDGAVRRNDKNSYSVPVLVTDFVAYLKARIEGAAGHPKQTEVAAHIDLSERSVREWEIKLSLPTEYTLAEFRIAYIRSLREEAAGRATAGGVDLATERARLAAAQAEKVEMQNAVTRGELTPTALLEQVLAKAAAKIAGVLDAIPGMVRRRVPSLTADDADLIAGEVAKARNAVAAMSLADLSADDAGDGAVQPAPTFEEVVDGVI